MKNGMSVNELIDKLMAEEAVLRNQLSEKRNTIRTIAETIGENVEFSPLDSSDADKSVKRLTIYPDTFFGKSQLEAASEFLEMKGRAASVDEILDALRRGGVKFKGTNPSKSLYDQMVRGTRRFVLVGDKIFGLKSFYPNMREIENRTGGKNDSTTGSTEAISADAGTDENGTGGDEEKEDEDVTENSETPTN